MAKTSNHKAPHEVMPGTSNNSTDEPDVEVPAAPQSAGDTTAAVPDRDRIALRAYELYLARGEAEGDAVEDWLTAEREFGNQRRHE